MSQQAAKPVCCEGEVYLPWRFVCVGVRLPLTCAHAMSKRSQLLVCMGFVCYCVQAESAGEGAGAGAAKTAGEAGEAAGEAGAGEAAGEDVAVRVAGSRTSYCTWVLSLLHAATIGACGAWFES